MRRFIMMILILGLCGMSNAVVNQEDASNVVSMADQKMGRDNEIENQRQAAIKQHIGKLKPLTVFGKVVDTHGRPVNGAEVNIHWESHDGYNILGKIISRWYATDENGEFVVKLGVIDIEPHIFEVKCNGYELAPGGNPYFAARQTGPNNPLLATSKANPVVFKLRKQGETSFLVRENDVWFQIRQNESGQSRGYDAIRGVKVRDLKKLVLNDEPLVSDMLVKAIFNTNDMSWTVSLSPGNTNGGIIVSEQLMYEAPATGYQPEYSFSPKDGKRVKAKYVYLKSREPTIYTRLEIEHVNASKEFFRLSGKAVTNPYGDRNLEQATDLPYEVTKQLTDEVKTSFRYDKRPPKPDLPKLVKEARGKADKSKQKSP